MWWSEKPWSVALLLALALAGCGERTVEPVMGILTFDAGGPLPPPMVQDAGPRPDDGAIGPLDAGHPPSETWPGEERIDVAAGGVLTNEPDIDFVNTGPAELVIVNANLQLIERPGGNHFVWLGEIENRGFDTICIIFLDAFIGGVDVLTVVAAPMYASTGGGTTSRYQCIGPGGRGAFFGIENDVSSGFIDRLFEVRYSMSGLIRNDTVRDPALPSMVSSSVVHQPEAAWWTIDNAWRTQSTPIYNFSADFYVQHAGLLWNQQTGYHLDDVPSFFDFEANTRVGYEREFEEWIVFPDYLVRRGAGLVDVDDPDFQRLSEHRRRRVTVRSLRESQ